MTTTELKAQIKQARAAVRQALMNWKKADHAWEWKNGSKVDLNRADRAWNKASKTLDTLRAAREAQVDLNVVRRMQRGFINPKDGAASLRRAEREAATAMRRADRIIAEV